MLSRRPTACGFAVLHALVACAGCGSEPSPPVEVTLVQHTAEAAGFHLMGVGSCTASGCHGGGKPEQIVGSEYNIWITKDPHAQAHSLLYDHRSQRIMQLLDAGKPNALPAYEDPRCLSCHSTTFAPAHGPGGDVVTDGVGCEACHGPAAGWLDVHDKHGFDAAAKQRLGFWDTKDLYTRAQVCASCHVGSPGREVTHDLIAAGHPRLQFELGAYLQSLPAHWNEAQDQARFQGNFALLTWLTGQAASSQSALRQLESRAADGAAWPEFAEWSCSACHHELRDAVSLQRRLARTGGLSGRAIRWDDWNHHLTGQYAVMLSAALAGDRAAAEQVEAGISRMRELMGSPHADRTEIAATANSLAAEIESWAREMQLADVSPAAIDQLSRRIVDQALNKGVEDWSEASQVYDALASLQQARLDTSAAPSPVDEQISTALSGMFDLLSQRYHQPANYIYRVEEMNAHLHELGQLYDQRGGP